MTGVEGDHVGVIMNLNLKQLLLCVTCLCVGLAIGLIATRWMQTPEQDPLANLAVLDPLPREDSIASIVLAGDLEMAKGMVVPQEYRRLLFAAILPLAKVSSDDERLYEYLAVVRLTHPDESTTVLHLYYADRDRLCVMIDGSDHQFVGGDRRELERVVTQIHAASSR